MSDKPYIYVASSWRNDRQHEVVVRLRDAGFEVYDFQNPSGGKGFAWTDVMLDPMEVRDTAGNLVQRVDNWNPENSSVEDFLEAINTDAAVQGFQRDLQAMQRASIFVMVLPCERDAHVELGWAAGAGKETVILLDNPTRASLMYRLADHISPTIEDLLDWLGD